MEWFSGDVGSAISSAKAKKAIFCVYITGKDEMSGKVLEMTESSEFSDRYKELVCIKIEQGTTTFSQFSQIYPVLMVPSIFYINSATGVDIEVTVTTGDEKAVLSGLDRAIEKFNSSGTTKVNETSDTTTTTTSDTTTASEDSSEPSTSAGSESQEMAARVSRARDMLHENVGAVGPIEAHVTPTPLDARVSRAKDLMQQKREEKEQEEEDTEKNKEIERRNLGRDLQELQRKQDEQKIQEMVKERQKEKEEQRAAKARVQAQIEQDRADRAERFKKEKDERTEKRQEAERKALAEQAAKADRDAAERSTIARLQFRLPDGRSRTNQFPADSTLDEVYKWVTTDLDSGFSRFSLSTTFPRRNLDESPRTATLRDLQLAPSGTILVLPQGGSSSGALISSDGSFYSLIMLLFTPFSFLWGLVSSFINPPPSRGVGGAAATPSGASSGGSGNTLGGQAAASRATRSGNVGRISNLDQSDDDETNTYNGNSTQQM